MEHRKMRKATMEITGEEAMALLVDGEYGVLSTVSADGQCYGVPVNHVVHDGHIYFHGLNGHGHKADNIAHNPNVSFTVVGKAEIMPDKYDTRYESVIVFGKAEIVEDMAEKHEALIALCEKFSKDFMDKVPAVIERDMPRTMIIKISIDHYKGKANRRD